MRRGLQRELRLQRRHLSSLLAESRRKRRYDKWVEATTSLPFFLHLFTGVRGRGILPSSFGLEMRRASRVVYAVPCTQRGCGRIPSLPVPSTQEVAMSTNPQEGSRPSVVLVHGAWADGSGWQGVYNLLKDDYTVRIVQNPTLSLEGD